MYNLPLSYVALCHSKLFDEVNQTISIVWEIETSHFIVEGCKLVYHMWKNIAPFTQELHAAPWAMGRQSSFGMISGQIVLSQYFPRLFSFAKNARASIKFIMSQTDLDAIFNFVLAASLWWIPGTGLASVHQLWPCDGGRLDFPLG